MISAAHIRAERLLSAAEVRDAALAAGPRAAVLSLQPVPDLVAVATGQPTLRMTLLLWFCEASLLLAAVGVYGVVTAVDSRVFALHGQFDEVAVEADHARIAAMVNARHPGRATHRQLAGLDHCATRHETMDKSRGNCGSGEAVSLLSDAVLEFLAGSSVEAGR